ncbi:MAG: ribbon-helix-helix protein, CopG family [Acidimicrobiia bacterium]
MRRTQIYLSEQQHQRLAARARRSGRSLSDLIREAIDRLLDGEVDRSQQLARYRKVLEETSASAAYLPPGAEYVASLRGIDRERLLGLLDAE